MCEFPDFSSAYTRKARKEHRCCECRGTIFKGETYHIFAGAWSGDFAEYKTCMDCEELRKELIVKPHDPDYSIPFGYLYEWVFEMKGYNIDIMVKYLSIMTYRNAIISDWMFERLNEAIEHGVKTTGEHSSFYSTAHDF